MKYISAGKRFTFLLLALSMLSCSHDPLPGVLRRALETEPSTLDPAAAVDYSSGVITSLIHSNLVRVDRNGSIRPSLASEWEISDGGKVYRFDLNRFRFSNGEPVTAQDVVYSFRRLLSPEVLSPRWWILRDLEGAVSYHEGGAWNGRGAEAVDDSTLVLRLERPTAHFLSLLSMPAAGIVNPGHAEGTENYGRNPCGSGPWQLGRWVEGERIRLVINPGFPGGERSVEEIVYRFIPEAMTRIAEFEVGNLDILRIPYAELDRWKSAGIKLERREELRVVYIGLNLDREPFSDVRVRRALNIAVDVESIIAKILFGAARKAEGVIPPVLGCAGDRGDIYRYNPQKADSLLEAAGFPDGFEMEIWQRESPIGGRILESVQAFLGEAGVEVSLVTRDWSAFKQAVNQGTPDAFYLDWFADYPDCENFIAPLFHSENTGGAGNRTGYASERVDSLIELASRTLDGEIRAGLFAEAEDIIYRDAPWIFLWFPVIYEAVSPRVKGYRMPIIFNGQRYLEVSL
jgi:peptide/nickel transport system substrate-binding protein/oligopeptide transport system substrate-binding protein